MPKLSLSDHAMLRWLERAVGMDIAGLRASIEAGLATAHGAAESIGGGNYLIVSGGMVYAVRNGVITTVLTQRTANLPRAAQVTGGEG